MKNEITFILEQDAGKLTTEVSGIPTDLLIDLRDDLGTSQNLNCGKPIEGKSLELRYRKEDRHYLWLHRLYHNSVVDGPGRRSVIQVAGCSIRCPGFIYSLEGAKYDLAHERHQQRTAYF